MANDELQTVEKLSDATKYERRIAEGMVRSLTRANPFLQITLGHAHGDYYVVVRFGDGSRRFLRA